MLSLRNTQDPNFGLNVRDLETETGLEDPAGPASLDPTDYRILRAMQHDARASDISLGEQVNLSSTATARRRKILEQKGIIKSYSVVLDERQLGFPIQVLVSIELSSQSESALREFERAVVRCPSMSFCSFVSGETDFIMMLHVRSFEDYDRVYRKELSKLPYVARIRSNFMLRQVAKSTIAPGCIGTVPMVD